jgi:ABC-type transporter Mla subunit MlaD
MPLACSLVATADSLTLAAAELAELVTLERPSDALDDAWAALSFTAPAASDVVDALRRPARRTANVDCRSTARDAARDIVGSVVGGDGER